MSLISKIKFYYLRVRNSSFPELIYRTQQVIYKYKLKASFKKEGINLSVPSFDDAIIENFQLPECHLDFKKININSVIAGELFTLNEDLRNIRAVENKFRNFFSADVPMNPPNLDIRMAWEPARLQHLTILMLQIKTLQKTPESAQLKIFAKAALSDWLDKNPFLTGPHYLSAMECGLRIPVFFYALKILDCSADSDHHIILKAIYEHAWWISHRLSLYSSLGNHTVCECLGLVFAGAIFNSTPEGEIWLKRGIALMEQELFHQILEDGGPAEQSLNYHRFVLDIYWLAVDFLEKNRLYDCTPWKPRLLQGEVFIQTFSNEQGSFPAIGDSDDGQAIAPGIQTQKRLQDRNILKTSGRPAQGKWLAHIEPSWCPYEHYSGKKVNNHTTLTTFSKAGYTVVRANTGLLLTFDHGPLGMAPLYGHGHADALSITLAVKGKPILVDPGTYRYNGTPDFRRYFRGTRAHNTVTIDGLDQAVQETTFIWSRPFEAQLVRSFREGDAIIIEGSHNGYERLPKPVKHHRKVFFYRGRYLLIHDTFSGTGVHDFELNYHLHPDTKISSEKGWVLINFGEDILYIKLLSGGNFNLIQGQESPLLGWFSPAYGIKIKSSVLHCIQRGEVGDTSFLTAIFVGCPNYVDLHQKMETIL